MNEIGLEPMVSLANKVRAVDQNTCRSLVEFTKNTSCQSLPVPLFFHCLGGTWEGHLQILRTGFLEFCIQGLPLVQVGQEIQFQCHGQLESWRFQFQTGVIRTLKVQRDSSAGEAATILLVEPHRGRGTLGTMHDSLQHSLSREFERCVISQVTEPGNIHVGAREQAIQTFPDFPIPTTELLICPTTWSEQSTPHMTSSRVLVLNASKQSIMAYHDYPDETDLSTLPVVVIAPGYGETKRDYLNLSYYFVSNGFQVLRYDHTNHVGESEGTHFKISLSSMKQDFQAVIHFAGQQWPHSPVIGIAASLAARVALKSEAECSSLALLVLLVGIVDVQQSVAMVHQEDVFASYLKGEIQDSANILGFNVGRQFLQDALTNKFSTLTSTLEDVHRLETPVMYIAAGKDAWIEKTDLATFKASLDSRTSKWLEVPEALHRIQENPKNARATYRQIVGYCHKHLGGSPDSMIHEPNRVDLGRQNRREKSVQSKQSHTNVGETFWRDYLGKFQTVRMCHDYMQLLDHVFHALGPIVPGQQFLDAGCGNGNAGFYFLQSLRKITRSKHVDSDAPIRYVGIDVVHEALERAKGQMTHVDRSLRSSSLPGFASLDMSWAQVDLQHPLPFPDNHFDRIISNLVLGYVVDPHATLRELFRVLAPGGRMVLSNLKPDGDFSGIYHNLVSHAGPNRQKTEARELLNNYGKIRQAEKEGKFHFFDHTEWLATLNSLHCVQSGVYPTFANQAYLIVLEKAAIATQTPSSPTPKFRSRIPLTPEIHHVFTSAA